jgi:hypothetical protein
MKATDTPKKPAAAKPMDIEIIVDTHEHNGEPVPKGTVIEGLDAVVARQLIDAKIGRPAGK